MKTIRKITSAILAIGIIAGSAVTGSFTETSADAAEEKVMYNSVVSIFNSRVNIEKGLFPNGYYWNSKDTHCSDEWSISKTPCNHVKEKVTGYLCSSNKHGMQCNGFAYQLAKDIWGTTEFYSTSIDQNYEPKAGDNVRLQIPVVDNSKNQDASKNQPHSIFITSVNGDDIKFAECNGELEDCKIIWNRDEYYESVIATSERVLDKNNNYVWPTKYIGDTTTLTTVNKDYLRKYGIHVERPVIAGDLNMNGRLDNDDAMIFGNTVMANGQTDGLMPDGRTIYSRPLSYYDVNGDGHVDTNDYNEIRYGSNNLRIVQEGESATCRWNALKHCDGFTYGDSYYVKNSIGGVSWIGSIDKEINSFSIPSRVYCSKDKCWYNVTEIGYNSYNGHQGERTCTDSYKIKTLYIPDTVKQIHSYAFMNWSITKLAFSGSNSQLKTIENNAFYGCKNLQTLDLTPAKKLEKIDFNAFEGCTALYHIDLPYTANKITLGSGNGSILGSTKHSSVTIEINNPNNKTTPSSNYQRVDIFDADYKNWKANQLYFYGKLFKVYYQNKSLGQINTYNDYLRP